jgi:hypothetical protein
MCFPCLFPNSKIAKDSCEESSSRIKSWGITVPHSLIKIRST